MIERDRMRKQTYIITVILFIATSGIISGCQQQLEPSAPPPALPPIVNEQESPPAEPVVSEESILSQSAEILNILSILPSTFKSGYPASVNKSKKDLGITNPSCSEVQVFSSETPYQTIWCFLCDASSSENDNIQLSEDMSDEVEKSLLSKVNNGVSALGLPLEDVQTDIQFPEIGDFALYGEGKMNIGSMAVMAGDKSVNFEYFFGFDMLGFRVETIHVYIYSEHIFSTSTDRVDLITIGEEICSRIDERN